MGIYRNLRFVANVVRRSYLRGRPVFLSHMVTPQCDCRCEHCDYWMLEDTDELGTSEVTKMLDEARSIGMTDYVVWGGEPLLRQDVPTLTAYADAIGLDVHLITNGYQLPARIDEFADDLWGLYVSIDRPTAESHDAFRHRSGIFERAVTGIERAAHYDAVTVYINCVVNQTNKDELEAMADLADDLDVGISFEIMEVIEGYNDHLALDADETRAVCQRAIALKEQGYPIRNSKAYFRTVAAQRDYACPVPQVMATIEWNGNVRTCSGVGSQLEDIGPLGNVRDQGLRGIFRSEQYEDYVAAAAQCSKCDMTYPVEGANLYEGDPEALGNFARNVYRG